MATIYILFSAVFHASSSTMFKADGDRLVRSAFMGIISGCFAIPLVMFVPFPAPEVWPWLLGASAFQLMFIFATVKSLEYGDLSFTYPITRGFGPICVILVLGGFFGEEIPASVLVGFLLVVVGIFEMAWSGFKHTTDKKNLKKALLYSLFGGITIGFYTIMDAKGVKLVETPWSYIGWIFVLFAINTNMMAWLQRRQIYVQQLKKEFKRGIWAGLLGTASYAAALLAFRTGQTTEIAALRETSIVFALLIGYFFLKEDIGPRRIIAVIVISVGAIVIKAF